MLFTRNSFNLKHIWNTESLIPKQSSSKYKRYQLDASVRKNQTTRKVCTQFRFNLKSFYSILNSYSSTCVHVAVAMNEKEKMPICFGICSQFLGSFYHRHQLGIVIASFFSRSLSLSATPFFIRIIKITC